MQEKRTRRQTFPIPVGSKCPPPLAHPLRAHTKRRNKRLRNNCQHRKHCDACWIFLVAARAILSASNTSLQRPDTGTPVVFENVVTEIGATTASFNGTTFTCPSTAFYFVHYRLKIRRQRSDRSDCRVELISCDDVTVSHQLQYSTLFVLDVMYSGRTCTSRRTSKERVFMIYYTNSRSWRILIFFNQQFCQNQTIW